MTTVFIAGAPARDAVAAGARLLDQLDDEARRHGRLAPGWDLAVNPDTVNVDDDDLCPLGQVFGNFWLAPHFGDLNRLNDMAERAEVLGFWASATPGEEDDRDDVGNRDQLNQRWREEIAVRAARRASAWVLAA